MVISGYCVVILFVPCLGYDGHTNSILFYSTDMSCESRGGACSATCEGEIGEDLLCGAEGLVCCLPNVCKSFI